MQCLMDTDRPAVLLGRHCSCPGRNCIEFNNKHILYDFSSSFWYTVANSFHPPSLARLPLGIILFNVPHLCCSCGAALMTAQRNIL